MRPASGRARDHKDDVPSAESNVELLPKLARPLTMTIRSRGHLQLRGRIAPHPAAGVRERYQARCSVVTLGSCSRSALDVTLAACTLEPLAAHERSETMHSTHVMPPVVPSPGSPDTVGCPTMSRQAHAVPVAAVHRICRHASPLRILPGGGGGWRCPSAHRDSGPSTAGARSLICCCEC